MLSYYKQLILMKNLGKMLGFEVKVREEGFDMLWIKGEMVYSFNLGYEGNVAQMITQALDLGYEHTQVILDDEIAKNIKGMAGLFTHQIDLRQDFSVKELMVMVIPKGRAIKRKVIASRLYKLTGMRQCHYLLADAVKQGIIEKIGINKRTNLYRLIE